MFLIVGLGNPGSKYRSTRHNVGYEVVDLLAERAHAEFSERKFKARICRARIGGTDTRLIKPETYMNLSGESVQPALGFFKLGTEQLIVIHDELDLEPGRMKLKKGGGHGGHNGLRSLIQHLPNPDFTRVRIGIGRPEHPSMDPADYVLSRFSPDVSEIMRKVIERAADAVEAIVRDGLRMAMNEFNRSPEESRERKEKNKQEVAESESSAAVIGDDNGQHA